MRACLVRKKENNTRGEGKWREGKGWGARGGEGGERGQRKSVCMRVWCICVVPVWCMCSVCVVYMWCVVCVYVWCLCIRDIYNIILLIILKFNTHQIVE